MASLRFVFEVTKVDPAAPIPVCGGRGQVSTAAVTLKPVDQPTDHDPNSPDGPCKNGDVWGGGIPHAAIVLDQAVLGEVGGLTIGRHVEVVLRPL